MDAVRRSPVVQLERLVGINRDASLHAKARGALCAQTSLGGTCADDAWPAESMSADFVLDVGDAGCFDCPDLLELERPAVETRK